MNTIGNYPKSNWAKYYWENRKICRKVEIREGSIFTLECMQINLSGLFIIFSLTTQQNKLKLTQIGFLIYIFSILVWMHLKTFFSWCTLLPMVYNWDGPVKFMICGIRLYNMITGHWRVNRRLTPFMKQLWNNILVKLSFWVCVLQIFRALNMPLTSRMLSEILSRLVETVAEQGEETQV